MKIKGYLIKVKAKSENMRFKYKNIKCRRIHRKDSLKSYRIEIGSYNSN